MQALGFPFYIGLAFLVALVGAWTALDLFRRIHANVGQARAAWLTAASVALGLTVWAVNIVATLGDRPQTVLRFDIPLTVLALALAAGGSGLGFALASRRRRDLVTGIAAGALLGAVIVLTRYVGLVSAFGAPMSVLRPWLLLFALGLAMAAAAGALITVDLGRGRVWRGLAAIALAGAVVGAHYLAAMTLSPPLGVSPPVGSDAGADSVSLALAVGGGAVFILFLASIAALFDRRFEALAAIEAKRNEAQLRAILDQTPVGIVVADAPSGEIRLANPEAEYLLGHPILGPGMPGIEEAYGAIDEQGRRRSPESLPLMRAVRRGYRTDRLVQRYRRPDGGIVMLEIAAAPIRDADGRIVQGVATFHDVTAKLKAEEALRQSQRMEGIGQLTGGVAHDFNNVLTAVLGSLQLASRRLTDERSRQLIDNAIQAAERGAKLTGQLLAFSRRQRLEPLPVDMNAMIERMSGLFASTLGGTVKVERKLGAELPLALADPAQLELALLNLALNARDAMPQGGTLTLSTSLVTFPAPRSPSEPERGRYVAVSVKDTGPGMVEEVAERAFEPFFTTKAVGKGSGLGLSQVLGLAKQLGGGVRLTTAPGKGVEVILYLPVSTSPQAAARFETTTEPPRARHGASVLVVDDDPDVRRFVVDLLEDSDYLVTAAADGPAGLSAIQADGPFDLILLDFAMPGMTGAEVARSVRAKSPGQPILMMTGYLEHEVVLSELGAQPMLQKPFDPAELLFRVSAMILA